MTEYPSKIDDINDINLEDICLAKYYVGIFSVRKKLEPTQITFTRDVINKMRNGFENGLLHKNNRNLFHLAFIIGIVESLEYGENRNIFYKLMNYYLDKVDKSKIPRKIQIPSEFLI